MEQAFIRSGSAPVDSWPADLSAQALGEMTSCTPFLVLDLSVIRDRYLQLRALLPRVEPFYAVKCNAADAVLTELAALGAGFEIASAQELLLVQDVGVDASRILYSNTVKPSSHIAEAFARGVQRFAADSEQELNKIALAAPGASVYVRVAVEDRHSAFPLSKKFGVPLDEACRLLVRAQELGLRPYGLTFHVGSQCAEPAAWRRAIAQCGVAMTELARRRIRIEMLDIGGGLPARYGDPITPLVDFTTVIGSSLDDLPYQPPLICAEPGRYLVAESGVLGASVIGVTDRAGQRWAHLDVGAYNGLMEALQTGCRWRFPLLTSRADHWTVPHQSFTVTGPTCDSSDTVFEDVSLPCTLAEGDRLYIGSAGAYTLSYASHFNGFPPPRVLFTNMMERKPSHAGAC